MAGAGNDAVGGALYLVRQLAAHGGRGQRIMLADHHMDRHLNRAVVAGAVLLDGSRNRFHITVPTEARDAHFQTRPHVVRSIGVEQFAGHHRRYIGDRLVGLQWCQTRIDIFLALLH